MAMQNADTPENDWWSDNGIPATVINDFPPSNGGPLATTGGNPAATAGPSTSFTNTSTVTPPLAPPTTPGGLAGPPPAGGNFTDPNYASAFVQYYANQPGANPSLKNDPNYWIGKITSGELGTDPNYIIGKFMTPEGAPAGSGPNPAATSFPPVAQYTAPTWQGGAPPTAPTFATYTAPTLADLEASPGYLARMEAGEQGQQRSAAAQGSVLNGGSQKALARYDQDYASNEYSNLVNQTQSGIALNNNTAQTGFGDAFANYTARYGQFTDAANAGLNAFQTNVTNQRNSDTDYWTRLNDLYQTGAGAANNSYKSGASA